ncbi:hypothetical protein PAXRUDRAFT_563200 [Paxillus rubicundulus Ve08.2h10]|uniref:Uncharacterized protein n=1 Tax=Paxillus rubicundulus Ve08.2h10 TaxID=930991 RepID=A0A0D0DZL3_9AGAM|nr:hypothetical protein PAXRUDRAFT_563200 [Paxillus rubicundulus Ve08.2h10]
MKAAMRINCQWKCHHRCEKPECRCNALQCHVKPCHASRWPSMPLYLGGGGFQTTESACYRHLPSVVQLLATGS